MMPHGLQERRYLFPAAYVNCALQSLNLVNKSLYLLVGGFLTGCVKFLSRFFLRRRRVCRLSLHCRWHGLQVRIGRLALGGRVLAQRLHFYLSLLSIYEEWL